MPISDITPLQRRKTQEMMLLARIHSLIATNSVFLSLNTKKDKVHYFFGHPDEPLPLPSVAGLITADDIEMYGSDSIAFKYLQAEYIIAIKDDAKASPIELTDEGLFQREVCMDEENSIILGDVYVLKQALENILEVAGYDNDWYYGFVQHGANNEFERQTVRITLTDYTNPKTGDMSKRMYVTWRIKTLKNASNDVNYATGDADITVELAGVAVEDATVWLTDVTGNFIEDAQGNRRWYTDVLGQVAITDLPSQRKVTVNAEKESVGDGSVDDKEIPNSKPLTQTVTIT